MLAKLILVPTDFSETAHHGVLYAADLARKVGAKLHLLHVYLIPTPPAGGAGASAFFDENEEAVADRLQLVAQDIQKSGVSVGTTVTTGDPSRAIVQAADEVGADLIVIGTHGRRGVQRLLLGSVAETVLRHAHCPVLAVRLPNQG